MKILKIVLLCIFVLVIAGYGLYKYKNLPQKPDYYEFYKNQDTVPEGKIGVLVAGLIMPDKISPVFFNNVAKKIFKTIVPWPARNFVTADKGVALCLIRLRSILIDLLRRPVLLTLMVATVT